MCDKIIVMKKSTLTWFFRVTVTIAIVVLGVALVHFTDVPGWTLAIAIIPLAIFWFATLALYLTNVNTDDKNKK